ncbi:MAG: metal-dependent transcriptional regulator [Opitutales bacterium]
MNETHFSESIEDYLEVIYSLSPGEEHVHLVDIAKKLNVKKPSVTSALNILKEKDLIVYEKYKPVTLTEKGEALAIKIQEKHDLLKKFFTEILGVESSKANNIACKIEHLIDEGIASKLASFIKAQEAK